MKNLKLIYREEWRLSKSLFIVLCTFFFIKNYSQVGIGNIDPKATLDVSGKPTEPAFPDGIIAPRLTGDQLVTKDTVYSTNQVGTIVYVTSVPAVSSPKSQNVTATGYYFFDGAVWQKMQGSSLNGTAGWQINGNTGVSTTTETLDAAPASANYLGTKDNSDLVLVTNNKVHAYITAAGGMVGGGTEGSSFSWGYNNSFGFPNSLGFSLGMTNHVVSGTQPTVAIGFTNTSANKSMIFGNNNTADLEGFVFGKFNKASSGVAIGYQAMAQGNPADVSQPYMDDHLVVYGGKSHIFYGYDGVENTYNIAGTHVGINVNPFQSVNGITPESDLVVSRAITLLTSPDTGTGQCSAENEGAIKYVTGTPGHFYGCAKNASGGYDWKQLDN